MGSGVLLAALVVLWFVVLVPMVVTRGDAQADGWSWPTRGGRCSGGGPWTPSSTPRPSASRSTATRCAPAVSCRWTCTPCGGARSAAWSPLAAAGRWSARWSSAPGCGRRSSSSTSPSSATCWCCARSPAASGWPPAAPPVPRPARRCAPPAAGRAPLAAARRSHETVACTSSRRRCRTRACRWRRCTRCARPGRRGPHAGSGRLAAQRRGRSGRRRHRFRRHRRVPAAAGGQRLNRVPAALRGQPPVVAPGSRAVNLLAKGLWRSPVAHLVRIEGVRGSTPLSSTPSPHDHRRRRGPGPGGVRRLSGAASPAE